MAEGVSDSAGAPAVLFVDYSYGDGAGGYGLGEELVWIVDGEDQAHAGDRRGFGDADGDCGAGAPDVGLGACRRVVLDPAVIQDMRHEATAADIDQEIARMQLGRLNTFMTRITLRVLRLRAFSRIQFERLAVQSAFGSCDVQTDGMSIEVRLAKKPRGLGETARPQRE